jgi:hypothetical protein
MRKLRLPGGWHGAACRGLHKTDCGPQAADEAGKIGFREESLIYPWESHITPLEKPLALVTGTRANDDQ